jgi:hypothetical protein
MFDSMVEIALAKKAEYLSGRISVIMQYRPANKTA